MVAVLKHTFFKQIFFNFFDFLFFSSPYFPHSIPPHFYAHSTINLNFDPRTSPHFSSSFIHIAQKYKISQQIYKKLLTISSLYDTMSLQSRKEILKDFTPLSFTYSFLGLFVEHFSPPPSPSSTVTSF